MRARDHVTRMQATERAGITRGTVRKRKSVLNCVHSTRETGRAVVNGGGRHRPNHLVPHLHNGTLYEGTIPGGHGL